MDNAAGSLVFGSIGPETDSGRALWRWGSKVYPEAPRGGSSHL